jgi:hypothetical protein
MLTGVGEPSIKILGDAPVFRVCLDARARAGNTLGLAQTQWVTNSH